MPPSAVPEALLRLHYRHAVVTRPLIVIGMLFTQFDLTIPGMARKLQLAMERVAAFVADHDPLDAHDTIMRLSKEGRVKQ